MIYTGYFAKEQLYRDAGLVPISIARYPAKGYKGARCTALAPTGAMLHMPEVRYVPLYEQRLARLDPLKFAAEVEAMGKDVVLLCFEKPSLFCHRHLVAKWLRRNGIPCGEFDLKAQGCGTTEVETINLF